MVNKEYSLIFLIRIFIATILLSYLITFILCSFKENIYICVYIDIRFVRASSHPNRTIVNFQNNVDKGALKKKSSPNANKIKRTRDNGLVTNYNHKKQY